MTYLWHQPIRLFNVRDELKSVDSHYLQEFHIRYIHLSASVNLRFPHSQNQYNLLYGELVGSRNEISEAFVLRCLVGGILYYLGNMEMHRVHSCRQNTAFVLHSQY
ncbi:hypothetical protein CDAR_55091 [Caerostris darwini]|uniref:Uncharacterized protein n=1 Tax=Caerostris darwini TaxID=1538125 RepID=A0AAV4PBE2_9ARAC|nr:hypothetical protein CDAR_55091 [Caerostris darwini]